MKSITITATDEPVIIRITDPATGDTIVERAFASKEVHEFVVEDGMLVTPIEALTPPPPETFEGPPTDPWSE